MKFKRISSKLQLRSSICCSKGVISDLWFVRFNQWPANTWPSVSNCSRCFPGSYAKTIPSRHAIASAASALSHTRLPSVHRTCPPDHAKPNPKQQYGSHHGMRRQHCPLPILAPAAANSTECSPNHQALCSARSSCQRSKVVSIAHCAAILTGTTASPWRLSFLVIHSDHVPHRIVGSSFTGMTFGSIIKSLA